MRTPVLSSYAKGVAYILLGAVIMSFGPLFVPLDGVGSTAIAMHRLFWGGLALLGFAVSRGDRLVPSRRLFWLLVFCSLFFTMNLAAWHLSIVYVGPGLASILSNLQIFFLAIVGAVFYKERLGLPLLLAIPLAIFGLWLLLDVDIRHLPEGILYGLIFGVISSLCYTVFLLILRRSQMVGDRLSATAGMVIISFVGVIFCAIMAWADGEAMFPPSLRTNLLLVLYGLSCQAVGWVLVSLSLPHLPASQAGVLFMLQPTLAFVWDVVLLGRSTSALGWLGAGITLLAVCIGAARKVPADNE